MWRTASVLWLLAILLSVSIVDAGGGRRFGALSDSTVGAAVVTVRAANALRVALVCTNTDSATSVRAGDALNPPTASSGVQLRPGFSITITATSEIRMISEGGNVTVACSEELQ